MIVGLIPDRGGFSFYAELWFTQVPVKEGKDLRSLESNTNLKTANSTN